MKPLVSVIVPCHDQMHFTRQCIAALVRTTRPPWELILVDNGSTDGTASYMQGVQDGAGFAVQVVVNPSNLGFPAACNQGLARARGEYLVLLNNDAVVTDAWADHLVGLVESGPTIGMVGPMSNYATPPQLVAEVSYENLDAMARFAARWRAEHRGQWFTAEKLSGFCLLLKRSVYEAVGGLDERFGLGFFDDDDLALRVRAVGWELAVARDLFVHHHGSQTFKGARIDAAALLRENQARFIAKWGDAAGPPGRMVGLTSWTPQAPAAPAPGRPRVSLTMIVRNEQQNLPTCLASVRGVFDEVVVVDTGSDDQTVAIARSFGARVHEFPWIDDFAAARNVALDYATGDFAFWLDADDLVEPAQREGLVRLLAGLAEASEPAGYVVRCACDPGPADQGGRTVVDHVRLFPLHPEIRWTYRVHEQILPALRRRGIAVLWSDVVIRHTGYSDPATRARKLDRDLAILQAELADRPNEPFLLFNIGCVALERHDPAGALDCLRRSLDRSAPTDSIVRKLHALIAKSHQMLGQHELALEACRRGLDQDPADAELLFRKAVLHRHQGDPARAEAAWGQILTLRPPERFSSVDVGIYGHLTHRNLARVFEERGDLDAAIRSWEAVLIDRPEDSEALENLFRIRNMRATR